MEFDSGGTVVLDDACRHRFDQLLVYKLDRLGRRHLQANIHAMMGVRIRWLKSGVIDQPS